jgi:3-oxoacyl-[acyl-carrier-protein] synthase-1
MSDKPDKAYVLGLGMITAVGANAEMTVASVKAGISRYQESDIFNKDYELMMLSLVPEEAIPPLSEKLAAVKDITARQKRMIRLSDSAINEAFVSYTRKEPVPLFLAMPETLPEHPAIENGKFIDYLIAQTGLNIDQKNSRVFSTGRAGGILAIDTAFKYFAATGFDYALVGGVDSYMDLSVLTRLDKENRIKADGIMDGFVPGEAAGFLLLVSERVLMSLPDKPLATIYMPGISNEPGHRYSDEPYLGNGLAAAFNLAFNNADKKNANIIYASLNGENFGAKELGVAVTRNNSVVDEDYKLEHPADCFGDIGAAFGPVLVGLASRNCANHSKASLVYCSSDTGYRGAILVSG